MCIPLNRHQLKKLMKEIDTDGSGEVDFDEVRERDGVILPSNDIVPFLKRG